MNFEKDFNNRLLDIVFDSSNYGTVIVDNNGKVQYINNKYSDILEEQIYGRDSMKPIYTSVKEAVAGIQDGDLDEKKIDNKRATC